ncbi:MAG: cell division protein FtsZ, partial [Alphaproteobacteria bacterium]|nr:cell division protein FtsZ [Alphaproteobacteria bacterium]
TFTEAFSMADDVLYQGVKGVTDLMVRPGLINLDFADVRAVMDEMGKAMMGTGEGDGDNRAVDAAEKAIANPLLDEISLKGAKGVLINITGSHDLTLFELDEAANRIREEVDADANIIVGSTLDTEMEGTMRVSVVATGIDANVKATETPVARRSMAAPLSQPAEADAPAEEPVEPALAVAAEAAPEEPTLFESTRPAAEAETDDLPPPAYRHDAPAFQPRAEAPAAQAEPARPGEPSAEALARLQSAVRQAPSAQGTSPAAPRPAGTASTAERPRFGINSLIGRMTGHPGEAAERPKQAVRQQPQVKARTEPQEMSAEEERIEIPAFLRRQAN